MHPLYPDKLRLKTIIVEKNNNKRNKNIYFVKKAQLGVYGNSASNSKGFDKKRKILMEVGGGGVVNDYGIARAWGIKHF